MITVIIPTYNRQDLLISLLGHLEKFHEIDEVIVVDSSLSINPEIKKIRNLNLKYISTSVASAALQRNIGLDAVNKDTEFVFFLDDDVVPTADYFSTLLKDLRDQETVGVSGIVVNRDKILHRTKPKPHQRIFHRMFLLDSLSQGTLLKSGVNVPFRTLNIGTLQSEWLIGCSAWRFSAVQETRFEDDFLGISLGEDVIFSLRMGKKGNLKVNTAVKLIHLESEIERITGEEFWKMWMHNRYRISSILGDSLLIRFCYWWSSFGQFLILLTKDISFKKRSKAYLGIIKGARHLKHIKI